MIYMPKIYSIEEIISYMENTTEESWDEKNPINGFAYTCPQRYET